jgi:hypothetical protein
MGILRRGMIFPAARELSDGRRTATVKRRHGQSLSFLLSRHLTIKVHLIQDTTTTEMNPTTAPQRPAPLGDSGYYLLSSSATGLPSPTYWTVGVGVPVEFGQVRLVPVPPTFQVTELGDDIPPPLPESLVMKSEDLDFHVVVGEEEALGLQPGLHLYMFYCIKTRGLRGIERWALRQIVGYDAAAETVEIVLRNGATEEIDVSSLRSEEDAMCVHLLASGLGSFDGHPSSRL